MNYGFVEPTITDDHFVLGGFGSLPKILYQPDGNWYNYLPMYEPQFNYKYDTSGCVVWGTLNCIETLVKRISEKEPNYSERYNYIISGVRPPGADPHRVANDIRHNGLINDHDLPFTDSFDEFLVPDPMTPALLAKGQEWLRHWQFGHDWVFEKDIPKDKKLSLIKEALQCSPLGVSVTAWFRNDKGHYYSPEGQRNNHWCVCYAVSETGYEIFDSYDQSLKTLTLDHDIKFCKRYHLMPQNAPVEAYTPILQGILDTLKAIYDQFFAKHFKGIFGNSKPSFQ